MNSPVSARRSAQIPATADTATRNGRRVGGVANAIDQWPKADERNHQFHHRRSTASVIAPLQAAGFRLATRRFARSRGYTDTTATPSGSPQSVRTSTDDEDRRPPAPRVSTPQSAAELIVAWPPPFSGHVYAVDIATPRRRGFVAWRP